MNGMKITIYSVLLKRGQIFKGYTVLCVNLKHTEFLSNGIARYLVLYTLRTYRDFFKPLLRFGKFLIYPC